MEQQGFISHALRSIYNFGSYVYLKSRGTGKAMLYLLVLSLVCGLISSVPVYRESDAALKEMTLQFAREFPDFTFTKKGFKVQGKLPVIYAEEGKSALVFDPSDRTGARILDKYEKGVYITDNAVIYKKSSIETREYSMEGLKEFAPFTKKDVEKVLSYYWVITAAIVFFYMLFYVAAKYFSAFLVALLGLIVKSIVKYEQSFDELFRLAIYALTVPIIIKTVAAAASFEIPWFFLIYYGIAVFYLYMGISALKAAEK
jgi:hypothetical protein